MIGIELAKLVASLPKQDPGIGAPLLVDAYREALGDAPAWAVHEARLKVIRGEAGLDPRFLPTPPQLVGIIDAIIRPLRQDLADLEQLSMVEPVRGPSVAETAQVASGLAEYRAELQASLVAGRGKAPPTAAQDATALRARLGRAGLDPSMLDAVPNARVR